MLKKLVLLHLFPLSLAYALVACALFFIDSSVLVQDKTLIKGEQTATRGFFANLIAGEQAELEFMASIMNKEQLTIFGSSEFSDSPYCSYNFLPDSMGIAALGHGHAYHQQFSILCELMAAQEYLNESKICIVLSPGWFQSKGTNEPAFLEFVRPNFLKRILNDDKIESRYKAEVGKYIHDRYDNFTGISNSMAFLKDEYLLESRYGLSFWNAKLRQAMKKKHPKPYMIEDVAYEAKLKYIAPKPWKGDVKKELAKIQAEFLTTVTNNDIYVYDDYYTKYGFDADGAPKRGKAGGFDIENCTELNDFRLLVDYMASRSVDCSFVLQPVNPYFYELTERNLPLYDTIMSILESNDIPYLNMYVAEKEDYEPGILKDVMHLGDYGWMKINEFLFKTYGKHEEAN